MSDIGDKQHMEEKAVNRRILLKILQSVKFLALPLRHNSMGEIDSKASAFAIPQRL